MQITHKRKMYEFLRAGKFGNTVQQWFHIDDFERDGYDGLVALRDLKRGGTCLYNLRPDELRQHLWQYPFGYNISPMVADYDACIFQGELMRDEYGLRMFYSTVKEPMRAALAKGGKPIDGVRAQSWLRTYFWPGSYEDMMVLLDLYPDHVIEFTCCNKAVGTIPHRNVVIWEVRKY